MKQLAIGNEKMCRKSIKTADKCYCLKRSWLASCYAPLFVLSYNHTVYQLVYILNQHSI